MNLGPHGVFLMNTTEMKAGTKCMGGTKIIQEHGIYFFFECRVCDVLRNYPGHDS